MRCLRYWTVVFIHLSALVPLGMDTMLLQPPQYLLQVFQVLSLGFARDYDIKVAYYAT